MPYILLISALLLNILLAVIDKSSSKGLDGNSQILCFSFYKTLLCAVFAALVLILKSREFSGSAVLISAGAGLFHAASVVLIMKSLKNAPTVYVNLIMSAGVIIPCLTLWIFFSVELSLFKLLCLVLLIAALAVALEIKKGNKAGLKYLIPLLFCYGFLMVMQNIFPRLCKGQSSAMFSTVMYGSSALILGVIALHKRDVSFRLTTRLKLLGVFAAVANLLINLLLIGLSDMFAAYIVFPTVHCLKLVAIILISPVLWHEKLSKMQICGCCAAIVLVCFLSV